MKDKIKKIDFPCPCGGEIKWSKEKVIQEGIDCGILDVETCNKCGTQYLPDWSMEIVEKKLKEADLWGVERKEIRFWKSGNSFILRLPIQIARKLGIGKSQKGYIYQEGEHKLAIEI